MCLTPWLSIKIGKLVSRIGDAYGGGSALPGLVMEKIYPDFVRQALEQLPLGVVVISGTNGKTSTTKIASQILLDQGIKVFTNPTGSNFLRGVASAILKQCDSAGRLAADVAILELDEAHATHFIKQIQPHYSLLLNIAPDQLDRFGEINKVAQLLTKIAQSTTDTVIINREDHRLRQISQNLPKVIYYGYSDQVGEQFQNLNDKTPANQLPAADVELVFHGAMGANIYRIDKNKISANLEISGLYNHFNVAGAIALAKVILKEELNLDQLKTSLAQIKPAFGRGEKFLIGGQPTELILVKNPSGFQMSINSLSKPSATLMIAINDAYSDGRDISWLWDVDFTCLPQKNILVASGSRCWDVTNRLKYDSKAVKYTQANLATATKLLLKVNQPRQIYASYTAMLQIRKILVKATKGDKL